MPELSLSHSHTDEYLEYHFHPAMDADIDRDSHWSYGLSSQGPVEEQKEEEDEQGSQDHELVHPLRQCS